MATPTGKSSINFDNEGGDLPTVVQEYKNNRKKVLTIYDECQELIRVVRTKTENKPESELLSHVDMSPVDNAMITLGIQQETIPIDPKAREKVIAGLHNKKAPDTPVDLSLVDNILTSLGAGHDRRLQNPCIAIVGQTKAGKSSFINVLLKQKIVAQRDTRMTARVTHLFYSSHTFVSPVKPDGTLITVKSLRGNTIPSTLLGLDAEKRRDPNVTNIVIKAGVKSPFLQQGIDVIDSPGLNENSALNDLSMRMVESLLPMIIYVIDGRKSLTEVDIADIRSIKKAAPHLKLIFFVTKLDPDKYSRRDNPDQSVEEISIKKLDLAFKKLKQSGFIAEDVERENCPEFHGASLWAVNDHRDNKGNPEDMFHVKQFQRLEACLLQLMRNHLKSNILEAVAKLVGFLEAVLEKIINRASSIVNDTQRKLNDIANIRVVEDELYTNAKKLLDQSREDLCQKLVSLLERKEQRILQSLEVLTYSDSLSLPMDGIVRDNATIQKCLDAVHEAICIALDSEIRLFVEQEIFSKQQQVEQSILHDVARLSDGNLKKTSFLKMLENRLLRVYNLSDDTFRSVAGSSGYSGLKKLALKLKTLLNFFKKLFKASQQEIGVNVTDIDWKKAEGIRCLHSMDKEDFAESVCRTLREDFTEKHSKFLESLANEETDIQQRIEISEEVRQELVLMAPLFATQYMFCLGIRGRYEHNVIMGELIGEGAQGKVYSCEVKGIKLALKTVLLPSDQLEDAAMEIYYSSFFQHPRLLKLLGVLLRETVDVDVTQVCTLTPLKKWDAAVYLKTLKPPLKDRLHVALQVSEAVEYLHKQGIMHRDLKLANILLDQDKQAFVADYGFCKPVGMANKSFVGTPIHIAPEIVRKATYENSVDVYSFGILLWYLMEGNGRHPAYARYLTNIGAVLYAATQENKRPERVEGIPDNIWELMNDCWRPEPTIRPKISEVKMRMQAIIDEL